jgi:hypothetical protein
MSRARRRAWIGVGSVAAVALVAGVVLAAQYDPVGTETSQSEATAWIQAHPDASSQVVTPAGYVLSITLDQAGHTVLVSFCPSGCNGSNRHTTKAADLHGPGSGAAVTIGSDGQPRLSWTDSSGPHLLVCNQPNCQPGSFL